MLDGEMVDVDVFGVRDFLSVMYDGNFGKIVYLIVGFLELDVVIDIFW